jgi:sigma-E factor negative regulatory protein RseA
MSDKLNEQLSALMDDECAIPELGLALRRLSGDAELKSRWQRYHLIGDTLRNNLPQTIEVEFSESVHNLIAAEPPLMKPAQPGWRHIKPLAGWAAAASISVAVGLGFSDAWSPGNSTPPPVKLAENLPAPGSQSDPSADMTESDPRLSNYLINHNEYSSFNSIRGIVPYMHMVTYNSNP